MPNCVVSAACADRRAEGLTLDISCLDISALFCRLLCPAAALIGALRGCFLQGFDGEAAKTIARCGSAIGLEGWQKGRFSGVVRLTAILCGEKNAGKGEHMYTRPLFTHRPEAEYRRVIKGRLKYWRKAANLSQAQAGKLAGVARSTWQAWEDPARDALPDVAALAAVADACRIEPGAALEWLVTEQDRKSVV